MVMLFRVTSRFDLTATCPLTDNLFVGDYTLSYDEVTGAWDESIVPGTVTLTTVSGSTTKRQFDAVIFDNFGGFDITVQMEFLCDKVAYLETNTGVGCGGDILLKPGPNQDADINNDSEIILHYVEDTDAGGCGQGKPVRIMRLTKN